ncbi:MAG: hypothetical protein RIF33_12865 [Cyclobacteriaceae bacterium]
MNFIILAHPRTGSNWVGSALNSHPEVRYCGEISQNERHDWPVQTYTQFKRKRFTRLRSFIGLSSASSYLDLVMKSESDRSVGFKAMARELKQYPCFEAAIKRSEIGLIKLTRRNLLKRLVSAELAKETGSYSIFKKSRKVITSITIDTSNLITVLNRLEETDFFINEYCPTTPSISVTYEDLVSQSNITFKELQKFLGLESKDLESKYKKQNTDSLSELIENYSDVLVTLKGTNFEKFLEE